MLVARTTCVGHSLGAHLCGLMSNYLDFRIERIIGLDPARPLIKPGNVNRLDSGDAKAVQVIHTNAGHYGESGKLGHVDFCMNGGRKQPYCGNTSSKFEFIRLIRVTLYLIAFFYRWESLQSHLVGVLLSAKSIQRYANPCGALHEALPIGTNDKSSIAKSTSSQNRKCYSNWPVNTDEVRFI